MKEPNDSDGYYGDESHCLSRRGSGFSVWLSSSVGGIDGAGLWVGVRGCCRGGSGGRGIRICTRI